MKTGDLTAILTAPCWLWWHEEPPWLPVTTRPIHEARAMSTPPVYCAVQTNPPTERCWQEAVHVPQVPYHSHTPEILGPIVGAAVGRLVGSGRGKDTARVVGAVLGGVGRNHDHRKKPAMAEGEIHYEER